MMRLARRVGADEAGMGINFYLFQLDAGVAWSREKAEVEGKEIREEARGEVALSFEF